MCSNFLREIKSYNFLLSHFKQQFFPLTVNLQFIDYQIFAVSVIIINKTKLQDLSNILWLLHRFGSVDRNSTFQKCENVLWQY